MSISPLLDDLKDCVVSGTSYKESGVKVSASPIPGEVISFYSIDDASNTSCHFRSTIDTTRHRKICDLIIHYRDGNVVMCLVELKGKDLLRALDQIESTWDGIRTSYPQEVTRGAIWRACVVQHPSAPTNVKQNRTMIKRIKSMRERFDRFKITKNQDIGKVLRD